MVWYDPFQFRGEGAPTHPHQGFLSIPGAEEGPAKGEDGAAERREGPDGPPTPPDGGLAAPVSAGVDATGLPVEVAEASLDSLLRPLHPQRLPGPCGGGSNARTNQPAEPKQETSLSPPPGLNKNLREVPWLVGRVGWDDPLGFLINSPLAG